MSDPRPIAQPSSHESSEVSLRVLVLGLALVGGTIVLAVLVSRWMFVSLRDVGSPGAELVHPLAEAREIAPEPRLESDPYALIRAQREEQETRLHTWRWVDRSSGVVAIPIERAIDLVATEGLPVVDKQTVKREER